MLAGDGVSGCLSCLLFFHNVADCGIVTSQLEVWYFLDLSISELEGCKQYRAEGVIKSQVGEDGFPRHHNTDRFGLLFTPRIIVGWCHSSLEVVEGHRTFRWLYNSDRAI